jgi:hypothetical protein
MFTHVSNSAGTGALATRPRAPEFVKTLAVQSAKQSEVAGMIDTRDKALQDKYSRFKQLDDLVTGIQASQSAMHAFLEERKVVFATRTCCVELFSKFFFKFPILRVEVRRYGSRNHFRGYRKQLCFRHRTKTSLRTIPRIHHGLLTVSVSHLSRESIQRQTIVFPKSAPYFFWIQC